MDPLTHALAGATLASLAAPRLGRRALVAGAAAALLPDLDVLIRSSADPLLAIEHHRGFTHSLVFAVVGGLAVAWPFRRGGYGHAAAAAMLAWLSHALLDAATTYGTRLFWPFSRYRVGLDIISIIDPLFTLIVLVGTVAAFVRRRRVAAMAMIAAVGWLTIGFVQRERASAAQTQLAKARGDQVIRAAVFPTIGNTIVWRSIYEVGGTFRIDRIRVPWLGRAQFAPVTSVPREAGNGRDFERFAWFSDGWVARAPSDPTVIGDARYSLRNDAYEPVWGIRFTKGGRTEWVDRTRGRDVSARRLWDEIRGRDPALRPLP